MRIFLIGLIFKLGACASFVEGFEQGQAQGEQFWQNFAVQAAGAPGWGQSEAKRVDEIKIVPQTPACIPVLDVNGRVLGCI